MKKLISIFFMLSASVLQGQMFESGHVQEIIKKGADHIYNVSPDSAEYYIRKAERFIPKHPVIPLMRAMTILWTHIPIIPENSFEEMELQLDLAVERAKSKDPDLKDPEIIFFTMASYGLLAEYYADQGFTLKAVRRANQAYSLVKKGFEIVDENPEFLLTTGLYNYFREKYPEKYPIYKPLLWFFQKGDMELGLKQLNRATNASSFTKVEARIYLSYIYLRYEYEPVKAQFYLSELCKMYPRNFYIKAKYLESLADPIAFKNAPMNMIYSLTNHESLYYKLAGYVFLAFWKEKIVGNQKEAEYAYRLGLKYGDRLTSHGEFFKSFGYLGLGRVLIDKNKGDEAKKFLFLCLKYAETKQIKLEAKKLLSEL